MANKTYKVGYYDFEKLEDAEARARKDAWRDGETVYIYKVFAQADKPEAVNAVSVKQVDSIAAS